MTTQSQRLKKWVAIAGKWGFKAGEATFIQPEEGSSVAFGIALSDARLTSGAIRFGVYLAVGAEAARILLGYHSIDSRYLTVGLGGHGRAYVISEFIPAYGWVPTRVTGSSSNLEYDRTYQVEVRVAGQRVTLEVDGIRVLDHILDEPLSGDQVGLFASGPSPLLFSDITFDAVAPTAFVAMQFSEPYTSLYEDVIEPVAQEMKYRANRVSEVYGPGIILQDIIPGIAEAKVVIAEITPPNPNVFYELGYAHALKKPTILLAERGKDLPFDISGYPVIFYDNSIRGKKDVEDNLKRHLEALSRD